MATKKRKRIRAAIGDVFSIELVDGSYGFGQVVHAEPSEVRVVLYSARSTTSAADDLGEPVSVLALTDELLERGHWPVVDRRAVRFDASPLPDESFSYGAPFALDLLHLYHGLAKARGATAIDDYFPKFLPTVDRVSLKNRTECAALDADAAAERVMRRLLSSPSVDEVAHPQGPAILRVRVRCLGDGMPSEQELGLRRELHRRLADFGTISDAGAGEGILELSLHVAAATPAFARTEAVLAELGISSRATIEVSSVAA